jgi:enoyl-CoA hydratase/carnithine racemase
MTKVYRTLRVVPSDEGVLSVVIDAPPMNLIGPELVRDLVSLFGTLESDASIRVVMLESADPDYFIPHVDLTKVAEYTAEAARRVASATRRWACCGTGSASSQPSRSRRSAAASAMR